MTVRWIEEPGTLGQFSAAQQARLDKAKALLPACYSDAFELCVHEDPSKRDMTKFPRCAELSQLWTDDKNDPVNKELHEIVERMPFCPEAAPKKQSNNLVLGALALAALGIGYYAVTR